MKWSNLKINKCPQCNKDFMKGLGIMGHGLMSHSCGFKISENRYREIVTGMVISDLNSEGGEEENEQ